jgi:hypothetical protein
MSISFADYVADQENRENVTSTILKSTFALCEILRLNYIQTAIRGHQHYVNQNQSESYHNACIHDLKNGHSPIEFMITSGRKYHKIILRDGNGNKSVHAFIDKKTGSVFKAASWNAPVKDERYNLLQDFESLRENATWDGSYLYKICI